MTEPKLYKPIEYIDRKKLEISLPKEIRGLLGVIHDAAAAAVAAADAAAATAADAEEKNHG